MRREEVKRIHEPIGRFGMGALKFALERMRDQSCAHAVVLARMAQEAAGVRLPPARGDVDEIAREYVAWGEKEGLIEKSS